MPLPPDALLRRHVGDGNYTDCFACDIAGAVSQPDYVFAFYTTAVFRAERLILRLLFSRPSTDAQAQQLAAGERDDFAAWRVEARGDGQLLLADYRGRTRSWLTAVARPDKGTTRLYFGSAVLASRPDDDGQAAPGPGYRALLGLHRVYSRVLLRAARRRLTRFRRA